MAWITRLLLGTALVLATLLLFAREAYEPAAFAGTQTQPFRLAGQHPPRDLTVRLHPQEHRHRDPTTIHLDWTVTKGLRYPDGFGKWVYLVNGQFPGPNIEARSGDRIVLVLHNQLADEGLAIHFHGMHMQGSNHVDGVVGITQRSIPPSGNLSYAFDISPRQAGTFWWHAHSKFMSADGLYGGLVVHAPADQHDWPEVDENADDLLLLIGDWYHRPAVDVAAGYDTWRNWGMEPTPPSLLVNGQGTVDCARLPAARRSSCRATATPRLIPQASQSRLRIVNVGAMSGISVRIPGDRMSVLTVDGGNPVQAQNQSWSTIGLVHPGERVDVVVDWTVDAGPEADVLEILLDQEYYRLMNTDLVPEQVFPIQIPDIPRTVSSQNASSALNLTTAQGLTQLPGAIGQAEPDQIVLLYTKIELLARLENRPRGFINRTYWIAPEEPLISTPRSAWDEHQLVPYVRMSDAADTWVDIVINNVDDTGHPFHLHGYDFYILSLFEPEFRLRWQAYNPYNHDKAPSGGPYNLDSPLRKDTVYVPAMGYAVLRIKADNPGLWFLHCHVLWHQGVGMAMTLEVGTEKNT